MYLKDYWAKSSPFQSVVTHGRISGRVAQTLTDEYLSNGTRELLQSVFQLNRESLRAFIGYLVSLHDIGKIEYSFQAKNPDVQKLLDYDPANTNIILQQKVRHEKTGKNCLARIWEDAYENDDAYDLFSNIIGAHHQGRNGPGGYSKGKWYHEQCAYEAQMRKEFLGDAEKALPEISDAMIGAIGALILALTILSDWISSGPAFADGEDWAWKEDAEEKTRTITREFLNKSGLKPTDINWPPSFCGVWPNIPQEGRRPLQREIESLFAGASQPYSLILLEAPMGEGKTEAGVYAALQMAKQWGKDGFYLALPTSATANQMVGRMRALLEIHQMHDIVRLLHSMAWLENTDEFKNEQEEADGIANWLAPIRRGLLGQYAVGTVDQAMLAATTVTYGALRLLGLSNKVLIIDEIHSYDAYMSEIIKRLLEWCKAMGTPVVMLSATLPPAKKQDLFSSFTKEKLSQAYPLITAIKADGTVDERIVSQTTHSMTVKTTFLPYLNDPERIAEAAIETVKDGGCICVLMNTVREAQEVYSAVRKHFSGDALLFHAQFPAQRRAELEAECIRRYGKDKSARPKRSILVATQVVEQSLDVDFDTMISTVAPVDLLLQRLGRVHRHDDTTRPDSMRQASIQVLVPAEGQHFGSSAYVYPECLLKSSIRVLRDVKQIHIPEDIASMVRDGYDPDNAPPEDLKQWMENQIKEQVEAGATQRFLINPPNRQYNALLEEMLYDDDAGAISAATRLGEPTVRIALLEPEQFQTLQPYIREKDSMLIAEVWDKNEAELVMLRSVSVRMSKFRRELSGLSYIEGSKLIAGTRVIEIENGSCSLGNGKRLCDDPELGIIVKDGEK